MNNFKPQIFPRCKADMYSIYIAADGTVYPCCWLGNQPHCENYRQFHGKDAKDLNVITRPLDEIMKDPNYHRIEESWSSPTPFSGCLKFCGQPTPPHLGKMDGTNEILSVDLSR